MFSFEVRKSGFSALNDTTSENGHAYLLHGVDDQMMLRFSPPPLRDNADDFKVQTAKHPNIGSAPLRPHSEQSKDRASKRLSSESNGTSEGGVGSSTPVELTALEESFRRFAIHGDTRATGKEMHGKNWSKLCKDCGVIDGKSITLTDVDIVFSKVK